MFQIPLVGFKGSYFFFLAANRALSPFLFVVLYVAVLFPSSLDSQFCQMHQFCLPI